MLYRELCRTTKPNAVDMGGCLILLQSWALYRIPFLASFIWMPYRRPEIAAIIPSSAYVDSLLWCTNASIINFNVVEWYHGDRVLRQFGCIQYIPDSPIQVGEEVHGKNKRGRHGQHWGFTHRRYITVWESRMARRPQMDMSSDLRPSLEYIQWYFSMGKPYLLGGQSTIVPPHVQRSGAYEPVADIEPDPQPDAEHDPEPEPEVQPEAESERSHSHSTDTSYHLDLAGNDYFPGSSSHSHSADTSYHPDFAGNDNFSGSSGSGYHYRFDMFESYTPQNSTSPGTYPPHYSTAPGPYPLQYSTPTGLYPPQHGTPPGSSSSIPFEPYDFSSMYQTPSLATEEDVGRRDHPQRERRPPQKYTPRTTPLNHQF
ncbi:hypothetical protein PVK06_045098 [Gossypium arboreum]|uniref:Aminotransferase-like plant mobile domain-containing protein n=1 Tax=Gossypium arboreum TaxID=29729 RepID=A0ABR0MT31_GOSAR|nr:hypothetical protein PVK06_045098 [Gossypium arboreum]